jgi:hypothetical protein
MLVQVTINDLPAWAFIDSGAESNLINMTYVHEWDLPTRDKKNPYALMLANGEPIDSQEGIISKESTAQVQMNGRKMTVTFDVAGIGSSDLILGLPWLQTYNPRVDWRKLTLDFPDQERPVQARMRPRIPTKRPLRNGMRNVEILSCYRLEIRDRTVFEIPIEYKEFAILFE